VIELVPLLLAPDELELDDSEDSSLLPEDSLGDSEVSFFDSTAEVV